MSDFKLKYRSSYEALSKRLREAREAAGLTQVEVAEKLGRNQSFVAKCESGERRIDLIELNVLADIYNTTVDFFLQVL